jgi:aspartate/methionine/tyrosine aminotransferase
MEAIFECCRERNATLIEDEAYLDAASLSGAQQLWTAAVFGAEVMATSSMTKIYGLSGLRTGWLFTNPELAERARQVMDLLSVNNAAPAATLARRAFAHVGNLEGRFRKIHQEGQGIFREWLSQQSLLTGYPNHGALFECLKLPDGLSSVRLNEVLVADYDTQVVPGRFFGIDDHIRLSLTLPSDDLTEALARIQQSVGRLVPRH